MTRVVTLVSSFTFSEAPDWMMSCRGVDSAFLRASSVIGITLNILLRSLILAGI